MSIEEHKALVINKHMREVHSVAFPDLVKMFSILKKCRGKLDCFIQEMLFIHEQKPKLDQVKPTVRFNMCKSIS